MHSQLNLFSHTKRREISGRSSLQSYQLNNDARAAELVELFVLSQLPYTNPETKALDLIYESKLKQLALLGVPTAVNFYRGLFVTDFAFNINIPKLNYPDLGVLLISAKEIALTIRDPYILINIFLVRTEYKELTDMEDALDCLIAAAEMEGVYATQAAYCLANLYGQEIRDRLNLPPLKRTSKGLLQELNELVYKVDMNVQENNLSFQLGLKKSKCTSNLRLISSTQHSHCAI